MALGSITYEEYYPWRRNTIKIYPWEQQYLNWEFLIYEKNRIKKLQEWYKIFLKSDINTTLESAKFYIVPLVLSPSWRVSLAEYGNFRYVGLSALYNSSQILIVGLIHESCKIPKQYHPIKITNSKRINIINKKTFNISPALIIDDWIPLKSDQIYIDVPNEKRLINKILNETLVNDKNISNSLQSPILSAPRIEGSIGGISLSSISMNSKFARELIKTIQLIAPPEYRTLSPPKMVYKGHNFILSDGIKFHLAERPLAEDNIISGLCTKKYNRIEKELIYRSTYNGEFSICSTLSPEPGTMSEQINLLFKKFSDNEITIPENIDDFIFADVDLTALKNLINEELWIQVVHSRQYFPGINDDISKEYNSIVYQLKEDFNVLLSDIIKKEKAREHVIRTMMFNTENNLKRIAQSFARADKKEQLDFKYLKQSRDLIIDNFTGLINHQEFKNIVTQMERNKSDSRVSVVQTDLINYPHSNLLEIYDSIKPTNLFEDIYDLQNLLDWLHKKGYVITDSNNKYT